MVVNLDLLTLKYLDTGIYILAITTPSPTGGLLTKIKKTWKNLMGKMGERKEFNGKNGGNGK